MNKVTGILLFLLPLTIDLWGFNYNAMAVCFVSTLSAIQEGLCIINDSNPDLQDR
jgi:CDP-diacylglycerol--glycerol-3-phosphate 3-phosphatidyltransferase